MLCFALRYPHCGDIIGAQRFKRRNGNCGYSKRVTQYVEDFQDSPYLLHHLDVSGIRLPSPHLHDVSPRQEYRGSLQHGNTILASSIIFNSWIELASLTISEAS